MTAAVRLRTSEAWRSLQVRAAGALDVFPLSLASALVAAARRRRELARGTPPLWLAKVMELDGLPCRLMMSLDRIGVDLEGRRFDVGLQLPANVPCPVLDDVFSVLVASPSVRSIGFYWSDASADEDLRLMRGARGVEGGPAVTHERLTPTTADDRSRFLVRRHTTIALPAPAEREARTLLKRLAGGRYTICLNLDAADGALVNSVAPTFPDARFFGLGRGSSGLAPEGASIVAVGEFGFSLHERLAFVQAADAYVGVFDEHACAAVAAERPCVLLGGVDDERAGLPVPSDGRGVVWLSRPYDVRTATPLVASFLRRFAPRP
jgi:hypothetical protein